MDVFESTMHQKTQKYIESFRKMPPHENFPKYLHHECDGKFCSLVTERAKTEMSLDKVINNRKNRYEIAKEIAKQLLTALAFLHESGYVHQCIKASYIKARKQGERFLIILRGYKYIETADDKVSTVYN